jgi:flagellin
MGLGQINTNLAALKAYNQLTSVNNSLTVHQERISTGKKVQKAADDPAGYYIARVYERELSVIDRNLAHVETASAQLQLEDSKMAQVVGLLQDVEDLVLQAKSELVSSAQKDAIKAEIDQLITEVSSVVGGLTNLSGIQVGAGLTISVASTKVTASDLGIMSGSSVAIKVATAQDVTDSLTLLSNAIKDMLNREEQVGAYISRLEAKGDAYAVDKVNKEAQKSVIEDADLASEQLQVTKYQILQQSALAMLAQANVAPQSMLQLITS